MALAILGQQKENIDQIRIATQKLVKMNSELNQWSLFQII